MFFVFFGLERKRGFPIPAPHPLPLALGGWWLVCDSGLWSRHQMKRRLSTRPIPWQLRVSGLRVAHPGWWAVPWCVTSKRTDSAEEQMPPHVVKTNREEPHPLRHTRGRLRALFGFRPGCFAVCWGIMLEN